MTEFQPSTHRDARRRPRLAPRLRLTATQRQLVELFELRGPAALTNWVRRYGPDPETGLSKAVAVPANPTTDRRYDLDEVVAWARRDDTPAKLRPKPAWWWRRAVAAWQAVMLDELGTATRPASELRSYVAALVLGVAALAGQVRRVRPRRDLIEQLRRVGFAPSAMEAAARELEADGARVGRSAGDPAASARLRRHGCTSTSSTTSSGRRSRPAPADQLDIALDELGGGRTSLSDTDAGADRADHRADPDLRGARRSTTRAPARAACSPPAPAR